MRCPRRPPRPHSPPRVPASPAAGLPRLHAAHREVARVREELAKGPRQVKARRRAVEKRAAEVEALRAKLVTLKKLGDEKNLQMQTNEGKIVKLRVQLNEASSNEVFAALKREIEADTAANAVLEDEILETLDRVDAAAGAVADAEADRDRRNQDADAFAAEVDAAKAGIEDDLAAAEKSLAEAETVLPASLRGDYDRLVRTHGAGALAEVADRVCLACQTTVSPQQKVQLNMGEFVCCRTCGRLLYRPG